MTPAPMHDFRTAILRELGTAPDVIEPGRLHRFATRGRRGDDARGCIGIAAGIETALGARCAAGVPTVAAYSAGALAGWQWPPNLRRLVVFADADPAGAVAADKLRQRARAAGLTVNVMTPTTPGADWCDVWAARKEATV